MNQKNPLFAPLTNIPRLKTDLSCHPNLGTRQKQVEYKLSWRESQLQMTMFYYRELQATTYVRKTNAEAAAAETSLEVMRCQILI